MKTDKDTNVEEQNDRPAGNPSPENQAGVVNELADPEKLAEYESNELLRATHISDSETRKEEIDDTNVEVGDNNNSM